MEGFGPPTQWHIQAFKSHRHVCNLQATLCKVHTSRKAMLPLIVAMSIRFAPLSDVSRWVLAEATGRIVRPATTPTPLSASTLSASTLSEESHKQQHSSCTRRAVVVAAGRHGSPPFSFLGNTRGREATSRLAVGDDHNNKNNE